MARVLMVTSALPAKAKAPFVKGSGRLAGRGGKARSDHRSRGRKRPSAKAISLDDVIYNPALMRDFINEQEDKPVSELRRKVGIDGRRAVR